MKLTLRRFSLLLALLSASGFAQNPNATIAPRENCPGVPGACGYPANTNHTMSPSNPSPQNGNGTLGVIYDQQKCGLDFASASQRLGKRGSLAGVNQPAPFTISGIPACAVIEKAYLWAEGSGNGMAQTATVNGPLGSANYPMAIVGQGPDKCWGYSGSYTYRADVTASVNGNGTYNISGILTNPPTSGNDMDGATLVVIWSLPSANWAGRIIIADGAYVVNGGVANYNMPFPAICGATNTGKAFFCVGDIQMNPTSWTANGTAATIGWNWWDYKQVNTTFAAGQTTCNFNVNTGGDCFNLCVAGAYFRTTTCTTCPTTTALTITTANTPASCSACNGTASVTSVTGGSAPFTYSWAPSGGTGATATGLCAGTYTVTVTANGGCLTQTATVTVPGGGGSITLNSVGQTNILCNGQCTGTATVSPSGGTGPYTYSWAPSGGTGTSATGLCAGTYTCTVTDANGCTGTRTFTITQPTALSTTGGQTNVLCNGQCTGSATVTASGGTTPYSYSWAPAGGTGATATALCSGTYTCTVTDANGCTTTRTFSITQPTALSTTGSQTNILCFGQCTGVATVTASGGTTPYTYAWAPSGGTGASASALCAGTYTCTVTDANGCTTTRTFTITQPASGITTTGSQTNILCNGQCTGSATVTPAGGSSPYTYAWAPSGGTGASASALCAGTYTCTVTDANGCTTTRTFTITQPTTLSTTGGQTNVLCNGQCTGSATVTASGGTSPYTYAWAPTGGTGTSASALCAGTYTVTVTDANGCTITRTYTITQPTAITATTSFTTATCGGNNGTATVTPSGGTGAYTYSWNTTPVQTTQTATGLGAGTYSVTVTDANGCTASFSVTVPNAGSPTASITGSTNITCFGLCNGTATGTASGGTTPYTYTWTPSGGTGTNATGLCAGTYTFTVTDANGCSSTASVTITQPTALAASGTQTNILCNGQCTGSATVTATGGTSPYTYAWAPTGGTGSSASALCSGTYTCTVTDANGCTITQSFNITQPPALAIAPTQTNTSCNGSCDGSATATVTGGTAPYSYAWAPSGGTGATASSLCAGTYTVTVTDANGCVLTQTYSITQPTAITATTSAVNSTCSQANGTATVNASGGTGAYTYSWNTTPVQTTQTATGLLAGPYVVTVTDANNCTATFSVTVINDASPTANLQASTDVTCFGACDGTATGNATGGTGGYTWSWNTTPVQTTATATGLCAGSYTCTVTDGNGCTSTTTVTITEPPLLTSSTTSTDALCFGACNGSAIVSASGGSGAYTYSWNTVPVQTGSSATGLCAGTYSVTVTDANGCTSVSTATISEPTQLTLAIAGFNATCNGACDGQVVVIPSGGTQPYSFGWNPNTTCNQPSCSNVCAGTYTVVVTDANGCTSTDSTTVTEPPAITMVTGTTTSHCNQPDGSAYVTASGGTGTLTYSWSTVPQQTTDTATALIPGTYSVTITDGNGCTATTSATVPNAPGVTLSLSASTDVTCFGACDGTASVTAASGTQPYTYSWNTNPAQTTTNATALCAGPYTCTVTDSAGCTASVSVTITEPPVLTVTPSAASSVCNGQSAQISASAAGGTQPYNYVWNPNQLSGATQTVTPGSTQIYTVTVTDANGCTATGNTTITVNPVPVAAVGSDVQSGCEPLTVNFTDLSTVASPGNIVSWSWDFGDGTGTTQNPTHIYGSAGVYTVILTVTTADGCTNTITLSNYISVYAMPVAEFAFGPQPTTLLDPNICFTDQSTNAAVWNWSFGDLANSSSSLTNPCFAYIDTGCFDVVLTVTTINGCMDTVVHPICIGPDFTMFIPNTFTPDGNGLNDLFFPKTSGIDLTTFEMWIFDRWGNMIYYTDDLAKGWDGRVQGHDDVSQIDTYVYKIRCKDYQGIKHQYIGHVNLIK